MSLASTVSLGALRLQSKQRADMENNPAISDPEWNGYISNSYKELYDMLVGAYGNEYYVKVPYQVALTGTQFIDLPSDMYKLLGVDLQYSASPSGWVSLRRFEFIDRNKYAYPNTATNWNGYTNLMYRIMGDQLEVIPVPMSGQLIQLWYIPEPTSLLFNPTCSTTLASTTVGVNDVADLSAGMSVSGVGIPSGATIVSVGSTSIVISAAANATQPIVTLQMWTDAASINGISGWEEYVIVDASIKSGIKQESDVRELKEQKRDMKLRIEAMAEGRDAGQASHVSDAMSLNGFGCDGFDSGFGSGGGW